MPDLRFQVVLAEPEPYAAGPLLKFKLHVSQVAMPAAGAVPIHAVTLQCQIRIEPAQRRYAAPEQDRLLDLFDTPALGPDPAAFAVDTRQRGDRALHRRHPG